MNFTKTEFTNFRKDFKDALKEVESKYGITIDPEKITYDDFSFSMKIKATKNDKNCDGAKAEFERLCKHYGFLESDYGREFTIQGKTFKLTGFNTRSPKNCCKIIDTNGRCYKCAADPVLRAFGHVETWSCR